jgi:hypothetical protein
VTLATRRNMLLQVLWIFLTGGLYIFYWFHVTAKEMAGELGRDEPITLWTVLLCLPPLGLYSHYKEGELYEALSKDSVNRWIIFILWLVFAPAVWFIVQSKLNELADHRASAALS